MAIKTTTNQPSVASKVTKSFLSGAIAAIGAQPFNRVYTLIQNDNSTKPVNYKNLITSNNGHPGILRLLKESMIGVRPNIAVQGGRKGLKIGLGEAVAKQFGVNTKNPTMTDYGGLFLSGVFAGAGISLFIHPFDLYAVQKTLNTNKTTFVDCLSKQALSRVPTNALYHGVVGGSFGSFRTVLEQQCEFKGVKRDAGALAMTAIFTNQLSILWIKVAASPIKAAPNYYDMFRSSLEKPMNGVAPRFLKYTIFGMGYAITDGKISELCQTTTDS